MQEGYAVQEYYKSEVVFEVFSLRPSRLRANFVNSFVSFSPFLELPTPLPIEPSQVIFFFLISMCFFLVVLEKCFLFGPRTLLPICLSFVWDSVSFALSCQNQVSPSTSIYLLRIARIARLNLKFCFLKCLTNASLAFFWCASCRLIIRIEYCN